jgi:putative flippase GtrA
MGRLVPSQEFLLFLLTGGFAAAVNFSSRILLSLWLPYSAAIVLAYCAGMVTAFVLAKLYVFTASQRPLHSSALWFVAVNLLAVAQTWLVSVTLAYYVFPRVGLVWHELEIAHLIGILVPVVTSYFGHKHWTFR